MKSRHLSILILSEVAYVSIDELYKIAFIYVIDRLLWNFDWLGNTGGEPSFNSEPALELELELEFEDRERDRKDGSDGSHRPIAWEVLAFSLLNY